MATTAKCGNSWLYKQTDLLAQKKKKQFSVASSHIYLALGLVFAGESAESRYNWVNPSSNPNPDFVHKLNMQMVGAKRIPENRSRNECISFFFENCLSKFSVVFSYFGFAFIFFS